jgi:hypothetical protein
MLMHAKAAEDRDQVISIVRYAVYSSHTAIRIS